MIKDGEIMKLRRSLIWVGGDNEAKFKAAVASNADVICFDVEDGVLPQNKELARQKIVEYIKNYDLKGKEIGVRINGVNTEYWERDLEVILPAVPNFLRLPKSNDIKEILMLDKIVSKFEEEHDLPQYTIEFILMIEDPLGLMCVYELCTCTPRVTAVGIGLEDFTTAMGMQRRYELGSLELIYAKQKLIVEAKAAGVQALESSSLIQEGLEYLLEDSKLSRSFGFTGRSAGEVSHVDVINRAFTPSEDELSWAREVRRCYNLSLANNDPSLLCVDGKAIDWPVVVKADNLLELDQLIKERTGAAC